MRNMLLLAVALSGSSVWAQNRVYVDFFNGQGTGTGWGAQATNNLQFAITAVNPGGEIWITGGLNPIQVAGAAAFLINKSVSIYGGFEGNESSLSERPCFTDVSVPSTIDPNQFAVAHVFDISSSTGSIDVRLDSLIIRRGGVVGVVGPGGAIRVSGSSAVNLTLDWCALDNNFALDGGAIAVLGAHSVDMIRCLFKLGATDVGGRGGFIFCDGIGNDAVLRMQNCVLNFGLAENGGAIYLKDSIAQLANCTFINSVADVNAVLYLEESDAEVVYCTFFSNVIPGDADVLFTDKRGCSLDIRNTIVTLNGAAQATNAPVSCVQYSCIEGGGGAGVGNIDFAMQPAHFPWINNNNYTPAAGTPVLDAGNSDVVAADVFDLDQDGITNLEAVPIDAAGRPRYVDDPQAPNAGLWSIPPVDMGAFERPALLEDPPVLPCNNLEI